MIILYLMAGLAFGNGLVLLLTGSVDDIPLVIASWIAAALLLLGNYRRLTYR
jgi:hypothetical protein